jgi:hypothetical protein
MLARRLTTILPAMRVAEAIEQPLEDGVIYLQSRGRPRSRRTGCDRRAISGRYG